MSTARSFHAMVVEDEVMIAKHLRSKIEGLPLPRPFLVTASASNGRDALEMIRTARPDVVFTDVRMPVMSGIELAEQIHLHFPDIPVVIVSGYGEFEYAQQAIRYDVKEYLLKPVNEQKLLETARKIDALLCAKRKRSTQDLLQAALLGERIPASSPLHSLPWSVSLVQIGNLCETGSRDAWADRANARWEDIGLEDWLTATEENPESWWIIPGRDCSCRFVLSAGGDYGLSSRLFDYLSGAAHPVTVCVSPSPVELEELHRTAYLAYRTLEENLVPCVSSLWAMSDAPSPTVIRQGSGFEELKLYVASGRTERLARVLQALLRQWQAEGVPQVRLMADLRELLSSFLKSGCVSISGAAQPEQELQALFAEDSSPEALYRNILTFLEQALFQPLEEAGTCGAELYRSVKKYMQEHYAEEITVEQLAELFHFSKSYLSRNFRKYGGQSPIQYLLQVRMKAARSIIEKHPDLELRIVSEQVGYMDQHYFSRYFKQFHNMSPSEFRQQCIAGKG